MRPKQMKETAGRETSQHITAPTQHQQAGKTTYDNSYPTLQELRAMNLLDAPKNAAGLPAQAPWPADNRAAPLPKVQFNNEETPSQGKTTKLVSGLTRKVHDKVKREVLWPHEFVFSSTGTVTPDNITLDQLVAGDLAINWAVPKKNKGGVDYTPICIPPRSKSPSFQHPKSKSPNASNPLSPRVLGISITLSPESSPV